MGEAQLAKQPSGKSPTHDGSPPPGGSIGSIIGGGSSRGSIGVSPGGMPVPGSFEQLIKMIENVRYVVNLVGRIDMTSCASRSLPTDARLPTGRRRRPRR